MIIAFVPYELQAAWWQGVHKRLNELLGKEHKSWIRQKLDGLYNMGKNLRLAFKAIFGFDNFRWLMIPGHEMCSSAVSSLHQCGFDGIGRPNVFIDSFGPDVKETADVTPSNLLLNPNFRRLKAGQPIRPGCIILTMSYGLPAANLKTLVWKFLLSFKNLIKAYSDFGPLLRDGIKQYQLEIRKHAYPAWCAVHSEMKTDEHKIFSQELVVLYPHKVTDQEIWDGMGGETPGYAVLEPKYLYEEGR